MDDYLVQVVTREAKDGVYFTRHGLDSNTQITQETENYFRTSCDGQLLYKISKPI
jgi:hypothetical protein